MKYIVEIEDGVWITNCEGGRTTNWHDAKLFDEYTAADAARCEARVYKPYLDARIYSLEEVRDEVCHCGMLMNDHHQGSPCATPRSMGVPPDADELTVTLTEAACARVGPKPQIEEGWLIERKRDGWPEWLYVKDEFFQWTRDSLQAIRFCRRSDAEQVAAVIGDEVDCITDHSWG